MAVGLIIFWPALFALGGTKQQEAEFSRLKGEYDALEQQAVVKKCPGITPPVVVTTTTTTPIAPPVAPPPAAQMPTIAPGPPLSAVALPAVVIPVAPGAPVAAGRAGGLQGESKHMFAAERFAKANGCASPVASMNLRAPDSETFTITCLSADPMVVRCEGSACRALK